MRQRLELGLRAGLGMLAGLTVLTFSQVVSAQDLGPYAASDDSKPAPLSSYSEIEILEGSYFVSQEVDLAVNGDLGKSGFVVRLVGGVGGDDYVNADVRGGKVDVDPVQLDALLGYQIIRNNLYLDAFVGVDYLDYALSPSDPSNPLSGAETGFKVAGSIQTAEARPIYAGAYGEYSTAYETYYSLFRVGYSFGKIIVGPEAALLGDETFNSQRVGGFVYVPVKIAANFVPDLYVSGGYSFVQDKDGDEGDGGVSLGAGNGNGGYLVIGLGLSF